MARSVQRTIARASRFVRASETSPAVYAVAPVATSLRSTTTVSVMPARARCQAMLAPRIPPPMTTTSAFVRVVMVQSPPHSTGFGACSGCFLRLGSRSTCFEVCEQRGAGEDDQRPDDGPCVGDLREDDVAEQRGPRQSREIGRTMAVASASLNAWAIARCPTDERTPMTTSHTTWVRLGVSHTSAAGTAE